MHEVGLMTQTLDLAESIARENGATVIHRLVLRVGVFSGVDAQALRLAFDAAAAGTGAEHAMLEIEEVAARCRCVDCGNEFAPSDFVFLCPSCGALAPSLCAGDELELATLEVS
jgi:hydrogenase nickel incorporation protein HypA/HybF